MIKVGFIRRVSLETLLAKVEGVTVEQGLLGRLFGYGTITVIGTGSTRTPFKRIAGPMEFRRVVQEQIETANNSRAATA
ncbi:PH domain-containing protein [Anaeromyxobacter sp. PSR-1]|uniref:PH domain-containing protein n=1 Tax=Anaeromyxobacter sp. PSR-1 TaxID=1300915 RepID=UPI00351C0BE5